MKSYRYSQNGEYIYHRHFTDLRGVDFSSPANASKNHFCDVENMWRDPKAECGALESYPGFRILTHLPSPIYGIYEHRVGEKCFAVVHAKDSLYRFDSALRDRPLTMGALSPLPVKVAEKRGCAFSHGDSLYLLIGGSYYRISPDGKIGALGEEGYAPYVPLTYYNGEMYEQRNLLTNEVRHAFSADGSYFREESGEELLRYEVYSESEKTCCVYALKNEKDCISLHIPSTATIKGETYKVAVVKPNAFANMTSLTDVTLPDTVYLIGADAFLGCTSLMCINLPHGIDTIGRRAFKGCTALTSIYLGSKLTLIGEHAFLYCVRLKTAAFGGTEEEYAALREEGAVTLGSMGVTVSCNAEEVPYFPACLRYPVCDPATELLSVALESFSIETDNTPYEGGFLRYRTIAGEGDLISAVELITSDKRFLTGKQLHIRLKASPTRFTAPKGYTAFGSGRTDIDGKDALLGCRAAVAYDGRIFFTANDALPNTVFHSLPDDSGVNNPFYIGNLSYFNDGEGSTPNVALLGTGDMLIVFKRDGESGSGIYYHTPQGTGIHVIPRVYPTSSGVFGVGALGGAFNFRDDPVFLSERGLLGIEKQTVNMERSLAVRSFPVDAKLCREHLENASLAVHEGILYLLTDGRLYLADSRRYRRRADGDMGYEWYFLSGVGSYENDAHLYRRSAYAPKGAEKEGIEIHEKNGTKAEKTVYSCTLDTGERVYYELASDGKKYVVDCDGERAGGSFSPATVLCTVGSLLLFGTESGAVGCMNTDKRGQALYRLSKDEKYALRDGVYYPLNGIAPARVSEDSLEMLPLFTYENETYAPCGEGLVFLDGGQATLAVPFGEKPDPYAVHRYFYSYASHAYTAACTLPPDDGDIPHRDKDSVPLSAAAKVKASPGSAFSVLVRTNRVPWHVCETLSAGQADFGDFDFSLLDFYGEDSTTVPLREREKRWCFKQYRFASTEAFRPFGIYALSYSFSHAGHIKL